MNPAATAVTPSTQPDVRYDGGPEEGSSLSTLPGVRYDGGPTQGRGRSAVTGSDR